MPVAGETVRGLEASDDSGAETFDDESEPSNEMEEIKVPTTGNSTAFVPAVGTTRVYDHDVRLEYKFRSLITFGFNAEIRNGDETILKVRKGLHRAGFYWKWNIKDLTGQTVMVVKRTGVLRTRFTIARLVVGTTNEFEKIYDVHTTSLVHSFKYSFEATENSGLQDVRAVWNLNVLRADYEIRYKKSRKEIGRYKDGIVTHRGYWLDVTAGQDVAELTAIGMVMEYFINKQKQENKNNRF